MTKLQKNNVSLTEYDEGTGSKYPSDRFFLQSGSVGFFATRKEIEDMHTVLNYYLNIEAYSDCTIRMDQQVISAIPNGEEIKKNA